MRWSGHGGTLGDCVPHIITLPGTRDGPDNIFAKQYVVSGTYVVSAGARAYATLQNLFWSDTFGSILNNGTIWDIAQSNVANAIGGSNLYSVENHRLVVAEAPNGNAYGISVSSRGSYVQNFGQV